MLKTKDAHIYEIYWEMMCHFRICANISETKSQGISHKVWATYLFRNLNESLGSIVQRLKDILQKQEMCLILLTKMKEGSKLAQCSGISTIKLGSPCQAKV